MIWTKLTVSIVIPASSWSWTGHSRATSGTSASFAPLRRAPAAQRLRTECGRLPSTLPAAAQVRDQSGHADDEQGFARRRESIRPHEGLEGLVDLGPRGGPVILAQLTQELHEQRLCVLHIAQGVRQRWKSVDEGHRPNVHVPKPGPLKRIPQRGRIVERPLSRGWFGAPLSRRAAGTQRQRT